jgi:D-sedoheptulose 7-phosphate isomerase
MGSSPRVSNCSADQGDNPTLLQAKLSDIAICYYESLQHAFAQGPPPQLPYVVDILFTAYLRRAHVYTLGNGACAALAAHMACDLGKVVAAGSRSTGSTVTSRLRVTSLVDNAALVTATANDFLYEDVFVEQLRHLINDDDVLIAISASGASPNVLRAVDLARGCGATTIGFTGGGNSAVALVSRCDIAVRSPTVEMEQIEDMHVTFHHIVTLMLRQRIGDHLALSGAPEPRRRHGRAGG